MPVNPRAAVPAAEYLGWRDACAKLPIPVDLSWTASKDDKQALVTDWTALGAIVLNLAGSLPTDREGATGIDVKLLRGKDGAFTLDVTPLGGPAGTTAIDLNAEVFDTSQDISPTQYGTMGIESALALKYIHLLRGRIRHGAKPDGSLSITFPPIETEPTFEQAA